MVHVVKGFPEVDETDAQRDVSLLDDVPAQLGTKLPVFGVFSNILIGHTHQLQGKPL